MLRKYLHYTIVGIYMLSTLTAVLTSAAVTAQQPDSQPLFEYSAINHPVMAVEVWLPATINYPARSQLTS